MKIAVGGFQHETNTFAPQRATWADFERADAWPGFVRGPELVDAVEGFNIPIAGAVKTLQELGHDLVPLCWCSAPPSSYVERDAYETVAGAMLEDLAAAGSLDGIYLDLHGAMVAEQTRTARASCCGASGRWSATACQSSRASTTTRT